MLYDVKTLEMKHNLFTLHPDIARTLPGRYPYKSRVRS